MGQKSVQLKDKDGNLLMPTTDSAIVAHGEGTVKEALDGIGIYPFVGIAATMTDVLQNYTSGSVWCEEGVCFYKIVYDQEIKSVEKVYEDVLSSALFRKGNDLYRYNGTTLVRLVDETDMATEINALTTQISTLQEQLAETPQLNIIPFPFPNGKQGSNFTHEETMVSCAFDGALQNYAGTFSGGGLLCFNDMTALTVQIDRSYTFSMMVKMASGYSPQTVTLSLFGSSINLLEGVTLNDEHWTKVSATVVANSATISSGGSAWIRLSGSGRVMMGNFKLETDGVATAWMPSLRDLGLF